MIDDRENPAAGSTTAVLAEESAGLRVAGYAAPAVKAPLRPFTFDRRAPGPKDILVDILYCGVCHSDIHQARDEWGGSIFPMVPGHEIVGKVAEVGDQVRKWKVGDTVGVGCFVDSDRNCEACRAGECCSRSSKPPMPGTTRSPAYCGSAANHCSSARSSTCSAITTWRTRSPRRWPCAKPVCPRG